MMGSHNTFSYLPTKKWWMELLSPWHRCQEKDLFDQIDSGARYLDMRVRFENGEPVFVHNNITYDTPMGVKVYLLQAAIMLRERFPGMRIPFRLILDIRKEPKDAGLQIVLLKKFVKWMEESNITNVLIIDEVRVFWNWDLLITSRYKMKEYHYSVKSKWYEKPFGIKLWERFHRKDKHWHIVSSSNRKDIVELIDYVGK